MPKHLQERSPISSTWKIRKPQNPLKYLGLVIVIAGSVMATSLPASSSSPVVYDGVPFETKVAQALLLPDPQSVAQGIDVPVDGAMIAQMVSTVATRKAEREEAERLAAEQKAAEEAARKKLEEELARQEAERLAAEQAAAERAAAEAAKAEEEHKRAVSRSAANRGSSDPTGARAIAASMVAERGWNDEEFSCLDRLWERESNWKHTAENPSSGAYGIPQALPRNKMASAGADWQTNPATQIAWGLGYIANRYGSPCGAWAHSEAKGWY